MTGRNTAVGACALDNLVIEIDGPEVPIGDGSFGPFLELLRGAGVGLVTHRAVARVTASVLRTATAAGPHPCPLPQAGEGVSLSAAWLPFLQAGEGVGLSAAWLPLPHCGRGRG